MTTLVTGTPGSGKTALTQYAESRGDVSFVDADEVKDLCEWREFETGKVIGLVTEHVETGKDDWYAKYGWYWRNEALQDLIISKPEIILCGSSENIDDFFYLFDRIIILKKTAQDLVSNLENPSRSNPYGKTPEQRKGFMEWQEHLIRESQRFNPVILEGNNIAKLYQEIVKISG